MKKLICVFALTAICLGAMAQSKMFWGLKGGVFYDAGSTVSGSVKSKDPSTLSFALKPSIGWYLGQNWQIGIKAEFADSKVFENGSEKFTNVSIRNLISNLTLGNGLGSNYISWKAMPYARYRICRLFTDRLNLWAELEIYAGQKFDRKEDNKGFYAPSTIYGAAFSPKITFDVTDKFMIALTPDLIRWDGAHSSENGVDHSYTGSFSAQFNPLYQVLSGVFNIGIIKKF